MPEYLVEAYVPRPAAAGGIPNLETLAGTAAELSRGGTPVRLLAAILVPSDETCFLHFAGPSDDAVRDVAARSGLQVERVVAAVPELRDVVL